MNHTMFGPVGSIAGRCAATRACGTRRLELRLAVAAALSASSLCYTPALLAADAPTTGLEEVIVTARKRTENLQEVPQSIDVFTSKDLENLSITRFEDYATRSPSVSFISIGPGTQMFFMRGVSDGSNPNVSNTSSTGFFVDDLAMSYYGSIPDLHMYDVERIEILNGPQGTLFGAGAMSGAIRIITNKPDVNTFSGGLDFDGGKIDGGGNNWSYEGFVNIPIVEGSTAVRMSAFSVYDGGFINNLLTTRHWVNGVVSNNAAWAGNDYNTQDIEGGRIAVKQVFSDAWQASLTYNYQKQKHKGAWDQDPSRYGERNVSRFGPENGDNFAKMVDLHVDGDIGISDLVYAGTYWQQASRTVNEYSEYVQYSTVNHFNAPFLQSFSCLTDPISSGGAKPFSGCKAPIQFYEYDSNTHRTSHELRLESKPGGKAHWIAGAYWEKTSETYSTFFNNPNMQPTGDAYTSQIAYYNNYYHATATPLPNEWYSYKSRFDYLETTEFGDLSYDLTSKWTVEAGIEHFESGFEGSSQYAGYFWVPKVPSYETGGSHKWNSKAGVNYKASDNLLLYANFGQGFRDGGVNSALSNSCYKQGAPQTYTPDTLNNYELGWKWNSVDRTVLWNGAVYYMDWRNYQTSVFDLAICPSSFNANLGNARIYGSESNVEWKASEALTLSASGSYNDSHLITNTYYNPNYVVVPGERLPYVPYFNYSANGRYEKPLRDNLSAYFQYDIAHKGDMWSDLRVVDRHGFGRSLQPAYDIQNVRVGVNPPGGSWQAELYVSNLANTRAVIFTNTGNYDHRETTNEPRVFGLRLKYRFGKVSE